MQRGDAILGGRGDDRLRGGRGKELIFGNAGIERFRSTDLARERKDQGEDDLLV